MTSRYQIKLILALMGLAMTSLIPTVSAHGRLWTPPARGTMWRKAFNTPKNYNDNEMFCGGLQHQINQGYKCGLCGDPYDGNRPNEAGGVFATGTISDTYKQGEQVTLQVDLTANHKGWFEFKICPTNDYQVKATQPCLDAHTLTLADGSGTKLNITKYGSKMIDIPVVLPGNLTCDFCVLQWHYHAGNNWGVDPDGKGCVGCGYQEEFYGCADIKIESQGSISSTTPEPGPHSTTTTTTTTSTSSQPESSSTSSSRQPPSTTTTSGSTTTTTTSSPSTTTTSPSTTATSSPSTNTNPPCNTTASTTTTRPSNSIPWIFTCPSARPNLPALIAWCNINCNSRPSNCPNTHCNCHQIRDPRASSGLPAGCYATTPFVNQPMMDSWCNDNCRLGFCPSNMCFCIQLV